MHEKLIEALREHAEWAHANEWEVPITLDVDLDEAAKVIEQQEKNIGQLKCKLESAMYDLRIGVCCETCAYSEADYRESPCRTCPSAYAHGNWEWRGAEADSHED